VISRLSGHIGDKATALVDDQLSPEATERAWAHVLRCPGCRQAVEYEAWVKRKLNAIADQPSVFNPLPSPRLMESLQLESLQSVSQSAASGNEGHFASRSRVGAIAIGTGAVGVVLAGLFAVTTSAPGPLLRPPATDTASAGWGTASLTMGALNVFAAQTDRIGDDTGLPVAEPGRTATPIGWRLAN